MQTNLKTVMMKVTDDTGDISSVIKRKDAIPDTEDTQLLIDCFIQLLEKMQYDQADIRNALRDTLDNIL